MSDDTPQESLIVAQDRAATAQPLLFSEIQEEAYEALEATGVFTGERLAQRSPQKYRLIVEMLLEGTLSQNQIARAVKVSVNTVKAVREREKIPVETVKEKIVGNIRQGLLVTSERVVELAPNMTARDAVIAVGVLTEKMQLLSGEATQIVGNVGDKVKHADFNALIDSLPVADAEVIEMGSPGGTEGQKGLADRDGAGGFAETSDLESSVLQGENGKSNGQGNNMGQADPDSEEGSDQGGRGSAEGAGGS